MKTRKGKKIKGTASNFIKADYLEMRLSKIEERVERLEQIVANLTRSPPQSPFPPRTIEPRTY